MSTQVPQETNNNAMVPTLYMALELSKKLWKLAFSDGLVLRFPTDYCVKNLASGTRNAVVARATNHLKNDQ